MRSEVVSRLLVCPPAATFAAGERVFLPLWKGNGKNSTVEWQELSNFLILVWGDATPYPICCIYLDDDVSVYPGTRVRISGGIQETLFHPPRRGIGVKILESGTRESAGRCEMTKAVQSSQSGTSENTSRNTLPSTTVHSVASYSLFSILTIMTGYRMLR